MTTETTASAAASGNAATDRFRASGKIGSIEVDVERVNLLASKLIKAANDIVLEERVSYDEFNALKAWLIKVGADGEWPLFLDVWLEHSVEDVATDHREGNKGSIEGPYYIPEAPEQKSPAKIEMRDDEKGTPLLFQGQVRSTDGSPLSNAKVELWHADEEGFYSQFAPGIPEWNLRGTFIADEDGNFRIDTMQPAPYQIPTDGACGQLIAAAGWHAWRPAHLHLKVSAPGHELLTAQLYFPGDEHNDDDIATAVKPELLLDIQQATEGNGVQTTYDFVLDPTAK
ncbi:catechol 1,2-dioxygenase [Paeniglutamicibacter gangotriensis]|uniref:Chlorocatechol 1,2-dioxygenase n=1 Tax=Paeniglutamicibacter gangotriensis Lz1y TaxID=1276920 RepID=M7MZX0_9MICC|nr:catechol 1,2-dioxygenase [Paeniglutamicibacter gangotriensis]EMR00597.1 Chlorocatechol 1,2-dioxygenase [Paeniglutamicibacter gangotriensis Lz1y]